MTIDFDTLLKQSKEVFHTRNGQCQLQYADMQGLIDLSKANTRKRGRLCIHSSPDDQVHQMFISHSKGLYIRPHKHVDKVESMLVLEGKADYLSFTKDGHIVSKTVLAPYESDDTFFQTTDRNVYHTIVIRSEWLVFVEVARGPFVKEDTHFPDWSPLETEPALGLEYLEERIASLIGTTG